MNKERYKRQILLGHIGEEGQQKLMQSHVVIIGCGGLGSIAAPYLAGAGIGRLTLVDGDVAQLSHLHRQVFFNVKDRHVTKSMAIAQHIQKFNPDVKLNVVSEMADKDNINAIINSATIVLECTDDIQAKFLINDACHLANIPLVYGVTNIFEGQVALFENKTNSDIHLRDIMTQSETSTSNREELGIVGTLSGIIGLLQANEAIKYITQIGQTLSGKLLKYNVLENTQIVSSVNKMFTGSVKAIFAKETYLNNSVNLVSEITLRDLFANRSNYKLISILDDTLHEDIDKNILRMNVDSIDVNNWSNVTKKPTVFYCMTGKESTALVSAIKNKDPEANVYSLIGGLKEYKNRSSQ